VTRAVPLLDLTRQFASIETDVMAEVARVFRSQKFILGEQGAALEKELADHIGVRHAIGVSSGTAALLVALRALGVGSSDEVVVPSFSFFATAGVVARLGARPVFADIDPGTFNLSPASFEQRITPRTKAVIPVHLYGQCAAMEEIGEIADRHGIAVVEDACQAIGARRLGRAAGSFSRIAAFSFFPTKNLGAAGDAGLVTTQDDALAARLRRLRVHGMEPKYHHSEVGGNFRLDEIQAAVLRVKLRHLAQWNLRRREIAGEYRARLAAAEHEGRLVLPVEDPAGEPVYHQFVVRVARRDEVRAAMTAAGIGTEIYYPVPLHSQECFRGLAAADLPESERAAREVLALPIFPELEAGEIEAVADALAAAAG